MNAPTLAQFQSWCRDIVPAAKAVLMSRVFADMERERVDAYVLPIFRAYRFEVAEKWRERGRPTEIDKPGDLYLSDDEAMTAAYFEECAQAHRAHGFTGPHGHCPALTADNLRRETENLLIDLAEPLFGIGRSDYLSLENRAKYLELLIGGCLKAAKDAGIEVRA